MALSPEELDDNMQTYEEFRIQVDREMGIPPEGYVPEPPKTADIKPSKPQSKNNPKSK